MFGRSSTVALSASPMASEDGRTAAVSVLPGVPLPPGLVVAPFEPEPEALPEPAVLTDAHDEVDVDDHDEDTVEAPVYDLTPNDFGPPPVVDATHDFGPPPVVDATPDYGPPPVVDATHDFGPPPVVDATPDYGPPPVFDATPDYGPPPVLDTTPDYGPPPVIDAPVVDAPVAQAPVAPPAYIPAVTTPPAYSAPPVYTPPEYAPVSYAAPTPHHDDPFLHTVPVAGPDAGPDAALPVLADPPPTAEDWVPSAPKRSLLASLFRRSSTPAAPEWPATLPAPAGPALSAPEAGAQPYDLPAPDGVAPAAVADASDPVAYVTDAPAIDVVPGVPAEFGTQPAAYEAPSDEPPAYEPTVDEAPAPTPTPLEELPPPVPTAQSPVPAFGHLTPTQQLPFPAAMEAAAAQIAAQVAQEHADAQARTEAGTQSTVVEVADDATPAPPAPPTVGLVFADGSHAELADGPEGAALQHVASVLAGDGESPQGEDAGTPNE